MTCKAASFGVFSHKRLKTDTGRVDAAFDGSPGRSQHVSILMCRTKHSPGVRHQGRASTELKPPLKRNLRIEANKHAHGYSASTKVSGKDEQKVSCGAVNRTAIQERLAPLTFCLVKKASSGISLTGKHATSTTPRSGCHVSIYGRHIGDRKRDGADVADRLIPLKRRKLGSDDFDENSQEDVTWSNGPDLLPVSCSLSTALPLKDDQRQTDIEVDDGYGSSPFNDTAGEQSPPHGCRKRGADPLDFLLDPIDLDDGRNGWSSRLDELGLPASVLSTLEQQFLSDNNRAGSKSQQEKLRRYAEGLERGMIDFLTQSVSLDPTKDPPSSSSPKASAVRKRDAVLTSANSSEATKGSTSTTIKPKSTPASASSATSPNSAVAPNTGAYNSLPSPSGEDMLLLEAAQGFMVMLDKQLRIVFVSDNVSQHLGYQQANMLGQSIEDYIHPKDLTDLLTHLKDEQFQPGKGASWPSRMTKRMFYVGMKFCFQKPGCRNKTSGYTLVQWNAKLQLKRSSKGEDPCVNGMVALCRTIRTDSMLEIRMDGSMFISRHDLGFHFIYCDPRIINLVGYEPSELIGRTAYQFHCPWDILICKQCHKLLIVSGSSQSEYYRFLSRSGKWVWLTTHATIVYDTAKNPQYVVCKNYVISEEEAERKISQERRDFEAMKCLGFSLETDLPAVGHVDTSRRLPSFYAPAADGDTLVKDLLNAKPKDISDNPYARPRKRRNISAMGVSNPVSSAKPHVRSLHLKASENRVLKSEMLSVNPFKGMSSAGSETLLDEGINSSPMDILTAPNSVFGIGFNDSLDVVIGSEQEKSQSVSLLSYSGEKYTKQSQSASEHMSTTPSAGSFLENASNEADSGFECKSSLTANEFDGMFMIDSFMETLMEHSPSQMPSSQMPPSQKPPSQIPLSQPSNEQFKNVQFKTIHIRTTTNTINRPNCGAPSGTVTVLAAPSHPSTLMKSGVKPCNGSTHYQNIITKTPTPATSKLFSLLKGGSTPKPSMPAPAMVLCRAGGDGSAACKSTVSILRNALFSGDDTLNAKSSCHVTGMKHYVIQSKTAEPKALNPILSSTSSHNIDVRRKTSQASRLGPVKDSTLLMSGNTDELPYLNTVSDDASSIMTNGNSDPFLSELTDNCSFFPDPYLMEEDLSPISSPGVSTLSSSLTSSKQSQPFSKSGVSSPTGGSLRDSLLDSSTSSSSTITLSDSAFSPANMRELDSFLSIIPRSPDPMGPLNDAIDSQSIPFQEQLGFCSEADTSQCSLASSASAMHISSGSNESSSDSETTGRPSLLRTLLDKEGEAIQGPMTYTEWILEEALKKKREMKKSRISRGSGTSKHLANFRIRGSKPGARKSTELPLPKSPHSNNFLFVKDGAHLRKPTKELPLPLSASSLPVNSAQNQENLNVCTNAQWYNPRGSDDNSDSSTGVSTLELPDDFKLPDDLLDLAVEYCGSLGADQAEALLSDINESTSFEDNLYSLISSPGQAKLTTPSSQGNHQPSSLLDSVLGLSSSTQTCVQTAADGTVFSDFKPYSLLQGTLSKQGSPAAENKNVPIKMSDSEIGKMSLLRAAVTSPDVDKLIEQIPFANVRKYQQSPSNKCSPPPSEDPDVIITKVRGLQTLDQSSQITHGRVFKVPVLSPMKSSGKTSPSKPSQSSSGPWSSSDHMDAILFDHFYTASMSMSPPASIQNSPPSPNTIGRKSSGTILAPRSHQDVATGHKVIFASQGSSNGRSRSNSLSSWPSQSGQGSPQSPRTAGITNSDLSSTQPVSVMIMKKDNHRSRRSKSIGLQTDNEPGEVYPEFERSSSDTILYPSVSVQSQSTSSSPHRDASPGTPLSSSPNMSELEKFLRGFSGQDDNSSSADEDSLSRCGTPFLQRLLTGELSKDNYQRIDQQMLEWERKSISSGSDQD